MTEEKQITIKDLATKYKKLRDDKDYHSDETKRLEKEIKIAEKELIDKMLEQGLTSFKSKEIGTLAASNKLVAKITDFIKFAQFLKDNGHEHLIKTEVNYMTLQSFANELGPESELLKKAHENGLDYEERATLSLRK